MPGFAKHALDASALPIHDVLAMVRHVHGEKMFELAARLGISAGHLSELESGKKRPSLAVLERFAKAFDITVSSIFALSEGKSLQDRRRADRAREVMAQVHGLRASRKVLR